MTRPSDTEAIERLLAEHEQVGWFQCSCGKFESDGLDHRAHVASILAARLAGAGAQVTEAAVEAAATGILHERTGRTSFASNYTYGQYRAEARAALSAALPHMGTGQSEADELRAEGWDECIKPFRHYGFTNVNPYRPAAAEGNET